MRCKTNGKYPRWICWENVFGVFSSSKGRDFQRVLEEIIGVVVPQAGACRLTAAAGPTPTYTWETDGALRTELLTRNGTESPNGAVVYLVADFGSERAGDILFERPGVSRYFAQGFDAWEGTARRF